LDFKPQKKTVLKPTIIITIIGLSFEVMWNSRDTFNRY
jgi:hypothetical protein